MLMTRIFPALSALAIAAALPGCMKEIAAYDALPPADNGPPAVVVRAAARAKGRIPNVKGVAEFQCELAASASGLRARLGVAGTGYVVDSVLTPDGFSAYLTTQAKYVEGRFDDLPERIKPYVQFARGGYVDLLFPRMLPRRGETCRCLGGRRHKLIEYYDLPEGAGPLRRRLWLDAATLRPVKLERYGSGRRVLVVEYLDYPPADDAGSPDGPDIPGKLRVTVPHVIAVGLTLKVVRPAPRLGAGALKLRPPESAERVRVGAGSRK